MIINLRWSFAGACVLGAFVTGSASAETYDFSGLTRLAVGAVLGQNVHDPVPGFEIRLLKDGEVLYHRSFGDWSIDRPANADSSTKTMSGALVMSVIDRSNLPMTLDSNIGTYLPSFRVPDKQNITIRQAFSHTSGLGGSNSEVGDPALAATDISLRQAAAIIAQRPLLSGPPGTQFAYGGASMHVVGAALEVATDTPFVDLFAQRISGPLQLTNTRFVLASDTNPRVSGGIESTASDFSRFMDMLLNDGVDRVTGARILSAESVREMLTRQTTDSQSIVNSPVDNNRYGVGVWLDQLGQAGPTVDAVAGGARGFHSWIDAPHGIVFTFATDTSAFSNVEVLSSMMHAEILRAIPEPATSALAFAALCLITRRRCGPKH